MASKIYGKAIHSSKLKSSGLFEDDSELEDSLLVAVIHGVYILYKRDSQTYYFISLPSDQGYDNLLLLHEDKQLDLNALVAIVESLKETIPHG
jgi:hypothetical protein